MTCDDHLGKITLGESSFEDMKFLLIAIRKVYREPISTSGLKRLQSAVQLGLIR